MNDKNAQTSENNLQELNDILFDNLRKLNGGSIDEKKATAVVNIANSIIGGAKTQLMAYKLTGGQTEIRAIGKNDTKAPALGPKKQPTPENIENLGTYELQSKVARHLGYSSVAPAISKLGKSEFLKKVDDFARENKKP